MMSNKPKLLIVGAGGLGRMVMESAVNQFNCYFIDDYYLKGTIICDCEVVGRTNDLHNLFSEYRNLIVAIGDNKLREEITLEAGKIGYVIPNIICQNAYVSRYVTMGCGIIILSNASVQNGAIIGDGVVITANVEVHHDCTIGDFSLIYSNSTIRTGAKIKRRVQIGSNVTISNGVTIMEDDIIKNGEVK